MTTLALPELEGFTKTLARTQGSLGSGRGTGNSLRLRYRKEASKVSIVKIASTARFGSRFWRIFPFCRRHPIRLRERGKGGSSFVALPNFHARVACKLGNAIALARDNERERLALIISGQMVAAISFVVSFLASFLLYGVHSPTIPLSGGIRVAAA